MRRQVRANEGKVFENENVKDTRRCLKIRYNVRANEGKVFEKNENMYVCIICIEKIPSEMEVAPRYNC